MRANTRALTEIGVLERRREGGAPPLVKYQLTEAGWALLKVGDALQAWLQAAPEGPILLGSTAAKSAIRAFVEGWSTKIVRALAAKSHSLTELSRLIPETSYPSLERRLGAMRLTKLVDPQPGIGRGTPYRTTTWLREAVVPLVAAAAWERRHNRDRTPPIGRLDVETAFLLAVPLLKLSDCASGNCQLAVELSGGAEPAAAGVSVRVENGQVSSCSSRLDQEVDASVSGSPDAWFQRLNGQPGEDLELGGERALAEAITTALRATPRELFPNFA
jgi:DNA-binding HxlR family transcriptional regulator